MDIQYNKQAKKYLAKLPRNTAKRIIDAINQLPDGDVVEMSGGNNAYRLRVGGFRILFDMNTIVYIRRVAPRGQVYKNRG